MRIVLNGERTEIAGSCTVAELLARRRMADRPCAVEVNRELVPKARHETQVLADGDVVEIVTLVGGG